MIKSTVFDIVTTMKITNAPQNKIEEFKTEICRDFYSACKSKNNLKTGLEIERLPVYKNTYQAVNYFGANGIYRLLRQIAYNDEWKYITDLTFINGLQKDETTITLEPGGQTEYSLKPQKNLYEIKKEVETLDAKILPILDFLGITLLEYPISPLSDGHDIEIIPKRRYQTMAKFMNGEKCFSMMRETAGIQVSIDYTDEIDAIRKYKTAMMLSPFVTAIFANSPIRCGKITGYKSTRALAWLNTDENRCGLLCEKLFNHKEHFCFADYIEEVLKVPVLFLQRGDKIVEIGGKTNFKNFLLNGFSGLNATKDDYKLHSTLFFPEVRLKNIVEIRNQDTQTGVLKYAIPALYKGILYNSENINMVFDLLKRITYSEYQHLRHEVPKHGLQTKIGNKKLLDYAKIILNIAFQGLLSLETGEEKLLEPIMELTYDELSPADLILKEWLGSTRKIERLVEITRIK